MKQPSIQMRAGYHIKSSLVNSAYRALMPLIKQYGQDRGIETFYAIHPHLGEALDVVELLDLLDEYFYPWLQRNRHLIGKHTEKEWQEKQIQYHFRCAYCEKKPKRLEKDHIIPIARGGTDYIDNIVPACRQCNRRKHTTKLSRFLSQNNLHFQSSLCSGYDENA